MEALCYIAGAGGCSGMSIERGEHDMVIAADGGYASLEAAGIVPDIAVGDFDSLGFVPAGVEVLRHPPEKDDMQGSGTRIQPVSDLRRARRQI